ncbi:MAG: GDSL-type esterase/lipase family protein, partial [Microterricola sp.]
ILVTAHKRLPQTRLLVQSVLPREPEFAPAIRDINRHLRQFSATVRAQYLDLWPVFADDRGALNPLHSEDGLHLTGSGYESWLNELRPAIERLFAVPIVTTPIDTIAIDADGAAAGR